MPFSTFVAGLALMSATGWAQYVLEDDYMGSGDFFGQFTFFTGVDPTGGFVDYVTEDAASQAGLLSSTSANPVTFGVDSTNVASSSGRTSVRLTSNKAYNTGLVIIDLAHMPGGICGTWPAFWMVGPNWPNGGEIDIIEGINDQGNNDLTLHTGPGCTINDPSNVVGTLVTSNCDINAQGQGNNQGCQFTDPSSQSYGTAFNSNNGGVYATEITSEAINIWFFPRGSIPSDISSGSPDPSGWGDAVASYSGSCDISSSFTDMQIVFDTTFCGSWAGEVWSGSSCASSTGADTCNAFVQNNPSAFQNAYWAVNSLKVYQSSGSSSSSSNAASILPSSSYSVPIPISTASPTTFVVSTSTSTSVSTSTSISTSSSSSVVSAASIAFSSAAVPPPSAPTAIPSPSSPVESAYPAAWTYGSHPHHFHPEPTDGFARGRGGGLRWEKEKFKRHFLHHKKHGAERL